MWPDELRLPAFRQFALGLVIILGGILLTQWIPSPWGESARAVAVFLGVLAIMSRRSFPPGRRWLMVAGCAVAAAVGFWAANGFS